MFFPPQAKPSERDRKPNESAVAQATRISGDFGLHGTLTSLGAHQEEIPRSRVLICTTFVSLNPIITLIMPQSYYRYLGKKVFFFLEMNIFLATVAQVFSIVVITSIIENKNDPRNQVIFLHQFYPPMLWYLPFVFQLLIFVSGR